MRKDFYLDTDRVYRSEKDVFADYTGRREKFFGAVPRTVWENMQAFEKYEAGKYSGETM